MTDTPARGEPPTGLPELGDLPVVTGHAPVEPRSDQYLRTLLVLLVSATFFEGYDSSILALLLGDIQNTFQVSEATLGLARGLIDVGSAAAFFFTRLGDRWGRRRLLLWSVVGYTVMTAATAVSWDIWSFTLFQGVARIFLGAEYAAAVTMVVEEYPADRRGRALGLLLMCAALGVIVIGLMLLFGVQDGPLEWRTLYLVGLLPLATLSVFRRKIQETQRFVALQAGLETADEKPSFWEPWRPEYRRNLVVVGIIHLLRSLPLVASTSWWAFYAERERGYTSGDIGIFIIAAYGLGVLGYLACGRAMERYGRRPTAIVFFLAGAGFGSALFQTASKPASFVLLILAVFFGLGAAPVTGAFATELFPTRIRSQAAAWCRNVFEIAGFVGGPLLVGVLGDHTTGLIGSIGDTVTLTMLIWLPGVVLVWRYIPETKGVELESVGVH